MVMGHYPQPGSSYERGPFIFQSVLVSLVILGVLIGFGIKVGAAVVAHVECSQVTKGQVLRSNTSDQLYCHVYER
jgi:hypothetical protein